MRGWVKYAGAACVMAFAFAATADERKPLSDAEFIAKAASGGLFEVEAGKLAQSHGAAADVKKFGEQMVTDHTKVNAELAAVVAAMDGAVPTKVSDDHQKHLDMLREQRGDAFDRAYARHMVKDHEADVELFARAAKECKDARLKAFAEKALPTLKEHHEMAKKIKERLEK